MAKYTKAEARDRWRPARGRLRRAAGGGGKARL